MKASKRFLAVVLLGVLVFLQAPVKADQPDPANADTEVSVTLTRKVEPEVFPTTPEQKPTNSITTQNKVLPNTGQAKDSAVTLGVMLLVLAVFMVMYRKKGEEK